ncbi:hypothetical protein OG730_41555 (plasmid) [Streptomyces sp. NBC_01298]|uniref:hypothetical protein n=1 Tax=Streptomyces sp. NBC_01298 TaxID=2903817 RepID=UPI002E0FEF0A|nr:hypothetical protein OG730_42470 [Streptomyces sp. NBC_01298]WSK25956.1 hypothetical protein OG730_41555 [Streptomyces sp. NBC_01298]
MTVYWVFFPQTPQHPSPEARMEHAPNLFVPERALQHRAQHQTSRVYYDGVVRRTPQPTEDFPQADRTALLHVWRRRSAEPVPDLTDTPDELWKLSPKGGLERSPWQAR